MSKKIVWGILYCIEGRSKKWTPWIGPCGIYAMSFRDKLDGIVDCVGGRPFFFRTRKLAREEAKRQDAKSNITRIWVKHTVRPYELTYQALKGQPND